MEVCQIKQSDVEKIISLWNAAGLEIRPGGRDSTENLSEFIKNNSDLCLCAEVDGMIAGCIMGSDDGRKGWFNRLAVHPDHRKKGIAAALIKELESALRKRGREVFAATIYRENAASTALFKKAGFSLEDSVVYLRKSDENFL